MFFEHPTHIFLLCLQAEKNDGTKKPKLQKEPKSDNLIRFL